MTPKTRLGRYLRTPLLLIATGLIVFYALAPFYFVLSVSVTPEQKVFSRQVRLTPGEITTANYFNLLRVMPYDRYFRNSTITAVSTVLFTLLVAIPAAYAFARFRFRGRRPLITGLLLLYMIPAVVLLVPLLIQFRRLGLMNTFQGLVLAEATVTIPFAVWLLVGYFASLPRELEEAAMVDGCSPLGALMRIMLPLSVPGVVAAGLFIFIATWNEFLYAFLFASGEGTKTLPVMMRGFVLGGEGGTFWGTVMASATLTTLPVLVLFLFFQRYLVGGLAAGSVKG